MPRSRRLFEENIEILFEELKLAIQWDRPSILLTVHPSNLSLDKAEKALEKRLIGLGQNTIMVEVNSNQHDAAHLISELRKTKGEVFFVSNLDWGGGPDGKDAYMSLNIYRELFIENRIRAVFWLTKNEASNVAKYAPDFWAFRHRVVEFSNPHRPSETSLPAGILLWHVPSSMDTAEDIKEKIKSREILLSELPKSPEALSARIELFYTLGSLYWRLGESQKALELLSTGNELAKPRDFSTMRSWLLNGMAIIHYEAGEFAKAAKFYKSGIENSPQDGTLCANLAITLSALGRKHEAALLSQRALRVDPTNARIWNSQGYLYIVLGKLDEAVGSLLKAIELSPKSAAYHVSLAVCYSLMGLSEEAVQRLATARPLANDWAYYFDVCEQAILDRTEKSLSILRAAVEAGRISPLELRRDANLKILLDGSHTRDMISRFS